MKKTLLSIFIIIIMMMTFMLVSVLADNLDTEAPEDAVLQEEIDIDDDETPLAPAIIRSGALSPWAFIISIAGVLLIGTICASILIRDKKK